MEKRNLICINCPMGCMLDVTKDGEEISVTGNGCKRGAEYARTELTDPRRIITTSLFVNNGIHPTVSVKTSSEVPKNLIFECMKELSGVRVEAPVKVGDVLVKNILNTGVDIVATRNVDKQN